jgi:stage II sporulation protein D
VAAHTAGIHIHLQTAAALRHELLHVLVETHATAALPVWFREGLVGYLENPDAPRTAAKPPADADLRQTQDEPRARRADDEAAASVKALVRHYGEATVLSWLAAGLPPEAGTAGSGMATKKSK